VLLLHKFEGIRKRHDVAIRLSAFYGVTFLIIGSYVSFLPLWLKSEGLSDTQIAWVYAMPVLLRPVFTTGMSFFADRSGHHILMLRMLALGAFASVAALPLLHGFPPIFAAFTLYALFWTTVIPLTDAVALAAARQGADYGRMRLWGSFSYIAVILAGGVAVEMYGATAALWLFLAAAASVVLVSWWLPTMSRVNGIAAGSEPIVASRTIRLSDLAALVRLPVLWLFLAATSAIQATHAVYYLFGTIHWTAIGIPPTVIGALWSIGVVAEIVLFAFAARVAGRFGPVQLTMIGGVAALIRWICTSFDPPLGLLFLLQAMHGLTFGATYLGAMHFMVRAFPPHMAATVQGVYASFSAGIGMGSAYLAAGPLYHTFGATAYLGMALLALVGLVLTLMLGRRWGGGSVVSAPEG
jgi:PPP family 3-phenylpropionic acid transporter